MNVEHRTKQKKYNTQRWQNLLVFFLLHDQMQTDHRLYSIVIVVVSVVSLFRFFHSVSQSVWAVSTPTICGEYVYALRWCCQLTYKNVYLHNSLPTITKLNLTTNNRREIIQKIQCMNCTLPVNGKMVHCGFNLSGKKEREEEGKGM